MGIDIPIIIDGEIEKTIFTLALDKIPTTNDIPKRVLKKMIPFIFPHLQRLFINCLGLAYYPYDFENLIIFVLKKSCGKKPAIKLPQRHIGLCIAKHFR